MTKDIDPFQEAMQRLGVKPIKHDKRVALKKPKEPETSRAVINAKARQLETKDWPEIWLGDLQEPDSSNVTPAGLPPVSSKFHRGGLTNKLLKRLYRGQIPIDTMLDLHGLRREEAIKTLNEFVNTLPKQQQYCVLIIHGKGHHTCQGKPILKNLTERWLQAHPRILAYCSAKPKDGGTGAVYAVLKRSPL